MLLSPGSILLHGLICQIFLAQPVCYIHVSVLRCFLQPADTLHDVADRRIVREEWLADGILNCGQILLRCQFQPVGSLLRVQQQTAIPVQQPQKVLGMDVTILYQPFRIFYRLVPLAQRQLSIFSSLKEFLLRRMFSAFPNDCIPDGMELFLGFDPYFSLVGVSVAG